MSTELALPHRDAARQRLYLRLIAVWKVIEGLLLLATGLALLLLDVRGPWLDRLVGWVEHELLTIHVNPLLFVLRKLQGFLLGGHLRSAGLLALIYSALHLIEGIGVWFEQRWGEWLMVIATAGLIPLEITHLVIHPTPAKVGIIVGNVVVVWYLITVLRRNHASAP